MKKILIPTDFSENAYNALNYGVRLFVGEECVFYLLHTYTPALYNAEFMIYSNLSLDEIYKLRINKTLTQVVSRIKKEVPDKKHHFKKVACFSLLQDEIKNQVKTKGIDLIIMGTQGATGAVQILMGTHTIHTIKESICPVLVIPSQTEYTTPSNLLFATDFEPDVQEKDLQIIKDIAENHKSKIHILHIIPNVPLETRQENNYKDKLADFFKDSSYQIHINKSDTVTKGILNFQKEKYMNVLVMARQKHSFFQNLFFRPIVDKVGFHLSTPFLVIPVLSKD